MIKTESLRLRDVRSAYRLIGECRDLGHEAALWQEHMLAGLSRLFGAAQATGGEGLWPWPSGPLRVLSAHIVAANPVAHARFLDYHRAKGPEADPIFRALRVLPSRLITRTRRELVSDDEWYRSESFNDFRRVARIDHELTSVMRVSDRGGISVIAVNRMIGEQDFSPRERRLLGFFHAELGRLIGGALVSETETGPEGLSRRLRQTLACLLEGDSEKDVAARLGLSGPTVHQYVTALYRHFGVTSRARLLAHVLNRRGRARWRHLSSSTS